MKNKNSVKKSFLLKVGFRYAMSEKNHKLPSVSTVISFLCIALGVATLIVVVSVMHGFRESLIEKILGFGAHVTVYPKRQDGTIGLLGEKGGKNITGAIAISLQDERVQSAYAVIEGQGMLVSKSTNTSAGVMVQGLKRNDFSDQLKGFENIVQCDFDDMINSTDTIAITEQLSIKMGVGMGSKVTLIGANVSETIFGSMPRHKTYRVACIVQIGLYQYDDVYAFMSAENASLFFQTKGKPTMIKIRVNNADEADLVSTLLVKRLSPTDYAVSDWKLENETVMNALKIEQTVMFLILSLFVAVAMLSIFSNLLLMVNEKKKSIAILRSMGVSGKDISKIFFLTGFIVALFGTIFGMGLGLAFSYNIQNIKLFLENVLGFSLFNPAVYFLSNLPATVQFDDIVKIFFISIFFATVASIIPARRVAKQKPAEILKYF